MVNGKLVLLGIVGCAVVAAVLWWLQPSDTERIISSVPARTEEGAVSIVAFGDSLTAGYGLPASEAYPAQLETALRAEGKSVRVINAGVSGETTRGNLERATFIRNQNPAIVLLGIGGNDALRQLSVADATKNITETINILKAGDNPPIVILLQMQAPLNAGLAYKRDFDTMYTDIAKAEDVILVPFLTTEIFLDSTNKLPDGIHLNQKGYGLVVQDHLLPVLIPLLEQLEGN